LLELAQGDSLAPIDAIAYFSMLKILEITNIFVNGVKHTFSLKSCYIVSQYSFLSSLFVKKIVGFY
jgi:hypothetical protein